jgi:hypothetical protein
MTVKKDDFKIDFPALDLSCIENNLQIAPENHYISKEFEISHEFTLESPYNDDLFNAIVDNRYDITITDRM